MSTTSAKAYEYTTETLFSGVQDAMQRQGFVSISEYVSLRKGIREESEIELLEVGVLPFVFRTLSTLCSNAVSKQREYFSCVS